MEGSVMNTDGEKSTQDSRSPDDGAQYEQVVHRLKALKELKDQGILTDEEYEKKRKPLVDQL